MFLILFTVLSFVGFFFLFLNVGISMLSAPNTVAPHLLFKPRNALDLLISLLLWLHVHIFLKIYYSGILNYLKAFCIYLVACEKEYKKRFLDLKVIISLLTFYLLWLIVDILFKDLDSFLGKKTIYSVLFKYVLYKLDLTFMVPYLLIIKNELILVFIRTPLVSFYCSAIV